MNHAQLIDTWRSILLNPESSWALFEHGTCVVLVEPQPDLTEQALEIMREYGPVGAGSSAGDFSVIHLSDAPGWVVTSHHPDVLTYVGQEDLEPDASDIAIGLLGRARRAEDADSLKVIHVFEGQKEAQEA